MADAESNKTERADSGARHVAAQPKPVEPSDKDLSSVPVQRVVLDRASFSYRVIIRVVVVTLLLLLVANLVQSALASLTFLFFLVVLAVFFAYLIQPLVGLIRRPFVGTRYEPAMPRSFAIALAYVLVFTALGFGIANVAPQLNTQGREFLSSLPTYATSIQRWANDLGRRFDRMRIPDEVQARLGERATQTGEEVAATIGNTLLTTAKYLPWLILVPILSFFFLKDVNLFRLSLLRAFPAGEWRTRMEAVLQDVNRTLAAYTRAQLISCGLIGVLCTVGFYLIGMKYYLLLGLLAGVLEFIPLLGPLTVGLIAVTTAGASDEPTRAFYVAGFLIVLRVVHDYFTYPRIIRGGIHLHPLAVILSVLAGEQVAGIPGVFMAIPIVAILTVFYKHAMQHSGSRGLFAGWIEEEKRPETVAVETVAEPLPEEGRA
ncbi:MAG: AI-2E family transporter [Pyrinomonadaceae bacterium]